MLEGVQRKPSLPAAAVVLLGALSTSPANTPARHQSLTSSPQIDGPPKGAITGLKTYAASARLAHHYKGPGGRRRDRGHA